MLHWKLRSAMISLESKGFTEDVVIWNPPSFFPTNAFLACSHLGLNKYQKSTERGEKNDRHWLLHPYFFPPPTDLPSPIFFLLHSLPSSLLALLLRHASVPANQHHSGQDEGARRERRGGQTKEHCCCLVQGSTPDWRGAVRGVAGEERVWPRRVHH